MHIYMLRPLGDSDCQSHSNSIDTKLESVDSEGASLFHVCPIFAADAPKFGLLSILLLDCDDEIFAQPQLPLLLTPL